MGKPPKNPETTLPAPCAHSSRLGGEIRLYGSMRSAASSDKRLSRLATMASVRLIPQKPGSATTAKLGTLN